MYMRKIPVLLDGDPGHDDAMAWVLANASPMLDIKAVTTCCGNQTLDKTTYNAGRIMALIGLDVPLAAGRRKPLVAEKMNAPSVHGKSGLDGPVLPEPKKAPLSMEACELMARTIEKSEMPVTIVSTGPMTNVAALLLLYPRLKEKIERISMMGGGIAYGNWTPAAEFNILVDPEAADIVFRSRIPITMAGLDVTEKALIYPADFERIREIGNPLALIVAEWLHFFYGFHKKLGYEGAPVHDAVAVAALVRPELMKTQDMFVQIETTGEYCRGMTVGDRFGITGQAPNARCIMDIDRQGFVDLFAEAVASYDGGKA